ncbi:MAG: sigma-54-dependent Fis family transcriptional regulator, partial [Proteobacteria bacterium]|nr:sigma-54-dependent Fis family transcriptional regulator [Pseudomonadota bacterium]
QHFAEMAWAKSARDVLGISSAAARKMMEYPWPGNVRELENCLERAVALNRTGEIGLSDMPKRIKDYESSTVLVAAADPMELVPMHVVEERYIRRVLGAVGNNKTRAARLLGFDRKTLYRKMTRYGIPHTEAKEV